MSVRAGLCESCRHARRVASSKGSEFWLCERSRTDPKYKKYPPLPVVSCPGHERGQPTA
jgi:hypothetical protein